MTLSIRRLRLVVLTAAIMCGCGGEEELPSRDQIPILQDNLFALEQAIAARDRNAIDTLLSVEILQAEQDSDSLLRFVYGTRDAFPFHRLGDYDIFYSHDIAVINCYIMDSTEQADRPLRLLYKHDRDQWLLKHFRVGDPGRDTDPQS